jgi:hypothetical protein
MSAELLSELEELRRLAACGFHPQAAVRAAELVSRTSVAPIGTPMREIAAEAMAIGVRSKVGLWGAPEERDIDELLLEVERSTGFGSSLHLYVLLTYLDVGWGAEARCRLLDALLAEAPVEAQDDRVDAVRFRRRLMRQLPADADWLASVRDGSVPFDGHASFNEWERRVLAGEHRPTWHWMGAAWDCVFACFPSSQPDDSGDLGEESEELKQAAKSAYGRIAPLILSRLGECPNHDIYRWAGFEPGSAESIAFVGQCTSRWERWFGMDSVPYAAFVVHALSRAKLCTALDGVARLDAEGEVMYQRARTVCRGAASQHNGDAVASLQAVQWADAKVNAKANARVLPTELDAQEFGARLWRQLSGTAKVQETSCDTSEPTVEQRDELLEKQRQQDAEHGVDPWAAERFWAAIVEVSKAATVFDADPVPRLLERGLASIVAGGHWRELSVWLGHERNRVSSASWRSLYDAAQKCFLQGRFGSGLRLLALAASGTDDSALGSRAEVEDSESTRMRLDAVRAMIESLQFVQCTESPADFVEMISGMRGAFEAEQELSNLMHRLIAGVLERSPALSVVDRVRIFMRLVRIADLRGDAPAFRDQLNAIRAALEAVLGADAGLAIEALRLELLMDGRGVLAYEPEYLRRLIAVLRSLPQRREEIVRCFVSQQGNVGSHRRLGDWIELLVQLADWQREAGISRWSLQEVTFNPSGSGLLDLTRKEADTDATSRVGSEPSIAPALFDALLATPASPDRMGGWQRVPPHGGNAQLSSPARELFDDFLGSVEIGSPRWLGVVFHSGLPVSYRIEALRRAIGPSGENLGRVPPVPPRPPVMTSMGWWSVSWHTKVSWAPYLDVLLRDLIHANQLEEARARSAKLCTRWANVEDGALHPPIAVFAHIAHCETEDQRLEWLRCYARHWRTWIDRLSKKPRGEKPMTERESPAAAVEDDPEALEHAVHGLALVGFELKRNSKSSARVLEGLECILEAQLTLETAKHLQDTSVTRLHAGPTFEIAAWVHGGQPQPHRVARLGLDALIQKFVPGSLEWCKAICIARSFCVWHKDDDYQRALLKLLESREQELDAINRRLKFDQHISVLLSQHAAAQRPGGPQGRNPVQKLLAVPELRERALAAFLAGEGVLRGPGSVRAFIEGWRRGLGLAQDPNAIFAGTGSAMS